MRCPACDHLNYILTEVCPACQFSGDPALVEELARLNWLLAEIDGWAELGITNSDRQKIQQSYQCRQEEIEIALKLRPAPLSEEEAKQLWADLIHREALLKKIPTWFGAGLLKESASQTLLDQLGKQIEDLQAQLADHPRPAPPQTDADRLSLAEFFLDAVDYLDAKDGFPDFDAKAMIRAPLLAEAEGLEIALGLRPKPAPQATVKAPPAAKPSPQKTSQTAKKPIKPKPDKTPPKKPSLPLTERIWRTLLSERTLQAILFLGIFLLFAAALSFVFFGWKDFSAPFRVLIPTAFTALFFALGRIVRAKTTLHRSGMALSAVAALLVPIDFYTLYANAPIPPDFGPTFWLLASLISAAAYLAAAYIIKSRFFGYLITAALGSAALALVQMGHQFFGLSLDWRSAALSLLALGLLLSSEFLVPSFGFRVPGYDSQNKKPETRNKKPETFLAEPFRYVALIAAATLMLLAPGQNYIVGPLRYDTLYQAMTVNWWVGGVIFGWGAVIYLSRSLGILAALSLPVASYFTQSSLFHRYQIKSAWHAFGLALLVLVYFVAAYKLFEVAKEGKTKETRAVLRQHGRAALILGLVLMAIAALWPFTDLSSAAPAAASHAALLLSAGLAFRLWKKPRILYGVSFFALSALTFSLTWLGLSLWQLSPGWDTLALAHLFAALVINSKFKVKNSKFNSAPLVVAGYGIAALALLPPLFLNKSGVLIYALGIWLGMSAWGARLAYTKEPGFAPKYRWANDIYHWLTAIPLPLWLLLLFAEIRPLDGSFALALAVLAWGMIGLSYRLKHCAQKGDLLYLSWYAVGLLTGAVAPVAAHLVAPNGFALPLTLTMTGALYLSDAFISRRAWLHIPGGLLLAAGWSLFFERWGASTAAVTFALAFITGAYFLGGLWVERKRSPVFTGAFLAPLYVVGHFLTLFTLARIYAQPLDRLFFHTAWTDAMQIWGAASQLLLGASYGLFAWGRYQERWAHLAVWLGAAGGGFAAIAFSQGRGSSAAKAALLAVIFVLAERGLRANRRMGEWRSSGFIRSFAYSQIRPFARLAWPLYRRPLLVTGWTISAAAIALALIRNLWLLGGNPTHKFWAWVGLLIIVGLYALSAWLFRRTLFVWLAAILLFAPWTILTNLGWYTACRPTTPGYALGWAALAWLLFVSSLKFRVLSYDSENEEQETQNLKPGTGARAYAMPLNILAQVLLVFSLLWGIADVDTSRFTLEMAIGLYAVSALLARRQYGAKASRLKLTGFLYPALGLVPVWAVYLMAWLLPATRHEHYGLMLLLFAPIGLAAGHWLKRFGADEKRATAYALPAHLTACAALIVGTMLTAHLSPLLAMVLLYDTLLLAFSARYFANPMWLYPAVTLTPIALLIALSARGTAMERRGWWLIALGAIYFALSATLRRVNLRNYGSAPLAVGLALIALGLPPSSQDQIGALWGYGSAALLYALAAVWLKQPLLLTPASALIIAPYAIGLQRSSLPPAYYGLALFPGAILALGVGWALDGWRVGKWAGGKVSRGESEQKNTGTPAHLPTSTPAHLHTRSPAHLPTRSPAHLPTRSPAHLLTWWGLPLYALGFGLATAAPFFTAGRSDLTALNFLLLIPVFGWGIYRFRLRVYLLAAGLAGHLAMLVWLAHLNWLHYPARFWLRFMPVVWLTALLAVYLSWRLDEGSPFDANSWWKGWSRPLYLLLGLDVAAAQFGSFAGSADAASWVTLNHILLITLLSVILADFWLPYAAAALGLLFTGQRLFAGHAPAQAIPPTLALLSLGYGVIGYALTVIRRRLPDGRQFRDGIAVWENPMQFSGLIISAGTLLATAAFSLNLAGWTIRAIFGLPFRQLVDPATALMVVQVLSYLGLLYLSAAAVRRQVRISYASVAMLLGAWMLYVFYIQEWGGLHKVQWYAAPAGLYLLAIGWQEWRQGHKSPGRWIDYAAIFLMLGSLFWQTLVLGWAYFALLMLEGLLFVWWGSARRLRRFLYAGLVGVVLATVGQLVNAALSFINQWVVFGLIGLLLIVGAVLVERKLEDLKLWQDSLEEWE